jgi:hypothetical protein
MWLAWALLPDPIYFKKKGREGRRDRAKEGRKEVGSGREGGKGRVDGERNFGRLDCYRL